MSKSETIQLPTSFLHHAQEWVSAGRFRSVKEAAFAALTALEEDEAQRQILRGQIDETLQAHSKGQLPEIEDGEFSKWLSDL